MLEKMEVEAVENRLKTTSSLIEFLKKGVERLFVCFVSLGDITCEFIKKPSYLIEKEVRYTKGYTINERAFSSKEVAEEVGIATPTV